MISIITTVNSIENTEGYRIIADIATDEDNDINLFIHDHNIIIVSILDKISADRNKIVILCRVGDFYIVEKEIIVNDCNYSNKFGKHIFVTKYENNYILAISDENYTLENGNSTGCVFLYKFIPTRGWCCIKELTLLNKDDEIKYNKFGNFLKFTDDGLVIGCENNNQQNYFLFKTNNFKHFHKQKIEYNEEELYSKISNSDNIYFVLDKYNISDGIQKFRLKYKQL